ncbi:MAG: nucleotidyltransferase [Solirubrobacteraceae bacterium]
MAQTQTHEAIAATLRKAAPALRDAGVPFMLGGSLACWARGGPRSQNDLDLMLPPSDAERALVALAKVGMRTDHPPEEWLAKAWDGDVTVDLIFRLLGLGDVTVEMIAAAEQMQVLAIRMPVMATEDILVAKLLSISEQNLDYGPPLEMGRSLREQIDWEDVRRRTADSPYARAFFDLLRELEVLPLPAEPHVRHVKSA